MLLSLNTVKDTSEKVQSVRNLFLSTLAEPVDGGPVRLVNALMVTAPAEQMSHSKRERPNVVSMS